MIILSEISKVSEGGCCGLYHSNIPGTLSIHLPEEAEENKEGKMCHYATSRKVAGSNPDEVIGFFN
jgi:hypothetical protein